MQKYNFDKIYDRHNTNSTKWDMATVPDSGFYSEHSDIVPMWIADMDFATAPSVVDALQERITHPIFGYGKLPDRYINAISLWQERRFNTVGVKRCNILYQNSVLGGVASAVYAYTMPGEYILTNSPTYTGFQGTVKNLGRYLSFSPLIKDENDIFRMDFEDMEKRIIKEKISMMIFCSPHNPTGRVWEKWEIERVVKLCDKHSVFLLSDEIWSDFVMTTDKKHIPTQSVSDRAKQITFAIYAPSKTFNLAGLIGAYSICYNPVINSKVEKASLSTHYNNPNVLSVTACCGAYEGGEEWLIEMISYIRKNQEYMCDYFKNNIPSLSTYIPEGTYLLWVDISKTGFSVAQALEKLLCSGILVNDGRTFLGDTHIRINLACPFAYVEKACERLKEIFG